MGSAGLWSHWAVTLLQSLKYWTWDPDPLAMFTMAQWWDLHENTVSSNATCKFSLGRLEMARVSQLGPVSAEVGDLRAWAEAGSLDFLVLCKKRLQ